MGSPDSYNAADERRHELSQSLALLGGEPQAELAAPPQHIVRTVCPFPFHQVAHLGSGKVGAEPWSELLPAPRRAEHTIGARSIGAHQTPNVLLAQERTRLPYHC